MPKYATGSWIVREALADREPFETYGALSATRHGTEDFRPNLPWGNQLPEFWRKEWERQQDRITYVVWSYLTPIAWVLSTGEVVKVPHKWSRTTSKHQGVLYALDATPDTKAGIREAAARERQQLKEHRALRAEMVRQRVEYGW